jgi:hypothetical protein
VQELFADEVAISNPPINESALSVDLPRVSEPLAAYGVAVAEVSSGDNGEREQEWHQQKEFSHKDQAGKR